MKKSAQMICGAAFFASMLSMHVLALSPEAEKGKAQFAVCDTCHNAALNPPLAPPMWGVQRRYKMQAMDRQGFIDEMADFVGNPIADRALFTRAVTQFGLMPAMALPEEMLRNIAAYLWEESFEPPCEHWKAGAEIATREGDQAHAAKDLQMLKRFCGQ